MADSVRSHYSCSDLELLFKIQKKSAQSIAHLVPRTGVGNSFLVEKEDLAAMLVRVREAKNAGGEPQVRALFEQIRTVEKPGMKRQKIRTLVRRDRDLPSISALPDAIQLRRGKLEVRFETPEQLAQAMLILAGLIETDDFERDYCAPRPILMKPVEVNEGARMLGQLQNDFEVDLTQAPN